MNWKYLVAIGCALSLAVTGCGDDNGDGNGGGGGGVQTYAEFQETAQDEYVNIICSAVYDCPEKQSPIYALLAGRFADKQDCMANADLIFDFNTGDDNVAAAIDAGRDEFDSSKAEECLNEVKGLATSCQALSDIMAVVEGGACETMFVAQQAAGESCVDDTECETGYCNLNATSECYGTCEDAPTPVGEGERCEDAPCQDGFACVYNSDDFVSTCVAENSRAVGEDCDLSADVCQDGLVCGLDSTCMEPPTYSASGESCDFSTEFCQPGLVCVTSETGGTCTAPLAQGDACQDTSQCKPGLFCDTEGTGNCEQPKGQGETCDSSEACGEGLECNFSSDSSTCEPETADICEVPDDGGSDADAGNEQVDAGSSMDPDAGM